MRRFLHTDIYRRRNRDRNIVARRGARIQRQPYRIPISEPLAFQPVWAARATWVVGPAGMSRD